MALTRLSAVWTMTVFSILFHKIKVLDVSFATCHRFCVTDALKRNEFLHLVIYYHILIIFSNLIMKQEIRKTAELHCFIYTTMVSESSWSRLMQSLEMWTKQTCNSKKQEQNPQPLFLGSSWEFLKLFTRVKVFLFAIR